MIKVKKWLNGNKVRQMCIRYDYYTCGDCRDYSAMLDTADELDPDDLETVKLIAVDIYNHSRIKYEEEYLAKDHVEGIMHSLLADCVDMYVELSEEERI